MAKKEKREPSLAEKIGKRQKLAKRIRMIFLGGGILFALVTFGSAMFWPPINDVTTGQTPEYPDLDPRVYEKPRRIVYQRVLDTLEEGEKFEVVETMPDRYRVKATCKSIIFTDDMTIWLEPSGPGGTIVFVRSQSRFGKGDFGANARHIRRFFEALDENI
jgi:uncharacterized protein (DUF1499 family)